MSNSDRHGAQAAPAGAAKAASEAAVNQAYETLRVLGLDNKGLVKDTLRALLASQPAPPTGEGVAQTLYSVVPCSAAEWFADCPGIANHDWRGGWDAARTRCRSLVDDALAAQPVPIEQPTCKTCNGSGMVMVMGYVEGIASGPEGDRCPDCAAQPSPVLPLAEPLYDFAPALQIMETTMAAAPSPLPAPVTEASADTFAWGARSDTVGACFMHKVDAEKFIKEWASNAELVPLLAILAAPALPMGEPGFTKAQRESIESAIRSLRYSAHPHRSPHADDLEKMLAAASHPQPVQAEMLDTVSQGAKP